MVLHVVHGLRPCEGEREAEQAHEPEAASPAVGVGEPSEERSKDDQSEILRGVEDCGGTTALCRRKPCGDDAPVSREDRRLRQAGEKAKDEDRAEYPCCGEIAGESDEKCADRPGNNADAVDAL